MAEEDESGRSTHARGASAGAPDDTASRADTDSRAEHGASRLVVLHGASPGRKFPLDAQSTIGRGSSVTVQIDGPMISRAHAKLERGADGTWTITDLESRNGTLLNGRVIGRAPLRYGDRIQIGETVLLFAHVDPIEERIVHRQKLEAIGRLGAGISHDINNVLAGVLANLEFMLSMGDDARLSDPEVREALMDVRASALLGADLTRRILSLAQRGSGEHAEVDLSALVEDALDLAQRTFDRRIRITREVARGVHVRGDRAHLQQMLMNLMLNAKDALVTGGTLSVHLGYARADEVDSEMVAVAGHHASLIVRDTGVGMSAETKRRLFEPFFTTKAADKGSGLGLSTVMDVVTAHGGTITCESEEGQGAAFKVILPALVATSRRPIRTPAWIDRRAAQRRRARILVVDDEPVSRRSICRLLARDGHAMQEAAHGREALELLARDPSAIDLVLMDLDMPELDGQQAHREMRRLRSDLRIAFLTGIVDEPRRAQLLAEGADVVLGKPCSASVLRAAIQSALAPTTLVRAVAAPEKPEGGQIEGEPISSSASGRRPRTRARRR